MGALIKQPDAREKKPEFSDLPPTIFRQLEKLCGDKIVSSGTAFGGLSASAGFIMTLASGRKVFAKGTHPAETAHGSANLAQEISAYQIVEALRDASPPYIGVVSDGEEDGWMLGVWECVEHDPALVSLPRIMKLLKDWQGFDGAKEVLPSVREQVYISQFFSVEKKWQRLKNDLTIRKKFLTLFENQLAANDWFASNSALISVMMRLRCWRRCPDILPIRPIAMCPSACRGCAGCKNRCYWHSLSACPD
ncbi:MAG: hypothetical protein K0R10_1328 [Alphaproteobacteria bacterium]|nr:hypothetical protein [Alphaproteobacteria bacterium]